MTILDQPSHQVKVDSVGRARALIFPIDWPEPFGLVMTEAMACGTPVITRPLGAAPEVVDHGVTGFLCKNDVEMADAVKLAADLDPLACRNRVERLFSAEAMVNGYESIYRSAIDAHPRTRSHLDAASIGLPVSADRSNPNAFRTTAAVP